MDTNFVKQAVYVIYLALIVSGQDEYQRVIKLCKYDSDCVENAYCKEQQHCECKADFISHLTGPDSFECLLQAEQLGDACVADIQCSKPFGIHAECAFNAAGFGSCNCTKGAHFKDGNCYETALIGQKCAVNNNCYRVSGLPAYCDRSVCVCPSKHRPNDKADDCIKSANLDEPCSSNEECITENSRCGEVCRCKVNYIQSKQKDACLKAADNLGDPCLENEQCTMYLDRSMCSENGECICVPGFHYVPPYNKCYRNILLGEMCEQHAECITPLSMCVGGTCQCEQGYTPYDNSCVRGSGQQGTIYSAHYTGFISLIVFLLTYFVKYSV